jgi:hypothetical protein
MALVSTSRLNWVSLVATTIYFGVPLMLVVLPVVLAVFPDLTRSGILATFALGLVLFSFTLQRVDRDHRSYLAGVIRSALESGVDSALPTHGSPTMGDLAFGVSLHLLREGDEGSF